MAEPGAPRSLLVPIAVIAVLGGTAVFWGASAAPTHVFDEQNYVRRGQRFPTIPARPGSLRAPHSRSGEVMIAPSPERLIGLSVLLGKGQICQRLAGVMTVGATWVFSVPCTSRARHVCGGFSRSMEVITWC